LTSVDFPLPVLPIIAVVSPGFAVNVISSRTFSSAPGYLKETWSNVSTPFCFSSNFFGVFGSWITVLLDRTSSTRSAATAALGSITDNMHIIRNPIIICIVYWINAIISPTCICPSLIPFAPDHMIKTEIPFIISIMIGIINVIARFTNRFVFIRSIFALSNRFSSCFSVLNALITGSPVNISLITRFTLSTNFCRLLNFGIATANKTKTTKAIKTTARPMIQDIETFV